MSNARRPVTKDSAANEMSRSSGSPSSSVGWYAYEQMRRIAVRGTILTGKLLGDRIGMIFVAGYPKSGTSWLSHMLADYFGLPRPDHHLLPVAMPSVVHSHARYSPRLPNAVYIYRDGRDVMVSYYFHRMARLWNESTPWFSREERRRYSRVFGDDFDPRDVRGNLPRFIQNEMEKPRGARLNWPGHVREWCLPRKGNVRYVSDEELLVNPSENIRGIASHLGLEDIDARRLKETIERFEFSRITGRSPGEESPDAEERKGIVGDWRNYFTREAARVFVSYAGDELTKLGYESGDDWVDELAM